MRSGSPGAPARRGGGTRNTLAEISTAAIRAAPRAPPFTAAAAIDVDAFQVPPVGYQLLLMIALEVMQLAFVGESEHLAVALRARDDQLQPWRPRPEDEDGRITPEKKP